MNLMTLNSFQDYYHFSQFGKWVKFLAAVSTVICILSVQVNWQGIGLVLVRDRLDICLKMEKEGEENVVIC